MGRVNLQFDGLNDDHRQRFALLYDGFCRGTRLTGHDDIVTGASVLTKLIAISGEGSQPFNDGTPRRELSPAGGALVIAPDEVRLLMAQVLTTAWNPALSIAVKELVEWVQGESTHQLAPSSR